MFKNRTEAGKLLAQKLDKYKDKEVVVYGMPRGGVVTAFEIAKYLHAPFDLVITRKIGHPDSSEYAIAAIAENGHIVVERGELSQVDKNWLEDEIDRQKQEAIRRKQVYLQGRHAVSPKDKIAILTDDGVATGLTLRAGIADLRNQKPKKIIVAVPVIAQSTAEEVKKEADELVALEVPPDYSFLGAVGAYYDHFPQVEDEEVIEILKIRQLQT